MEGQRKQKKVTQNSLLNQFKIIKQKLQQRGTTILQLKKQLQIERNSMLETLSQFQAHQNRIMSRLRRLQEINLRYIKQYAEIKKIAPPQEMLILTTDKIREVSMRDILLLKVRHYKEYYSQITQNVARPVSQAFHKTVSNVRGLLQQYLVEKQINYHKTMQNLSEQKKKKWKQAKGLESYKISKQQQKMLDSLKLKVNKFKQILGNVNDLNMAEIYNQRKQIQSQIYKLDPSRQEMTLEQSINQQRTFNQIMQEIIMINTEESPADNISQAFLNCQFKALQEKVIDLSQEYDQQFLTQSIGRIQNLSKEMKEGIKRGLSQKQLAQIAQKQRYANTRSQKHQSDKANMNEGDYEQGTYGGLSQNQKTKKYHRSQHNYGQNFQQQQNQNEIDDDFHSQNSENLKFKKKKKYNQNDKESDQISQYDEDGNPLEKQENQKKIKSKKQQRASRPSKLNAAFQTTMTKTFFQEQQKTRDELIGKQITQLQQHQKVIDKLITFIKKEFKDKKMDDIDADDPEQLMGYYFRVNEKKYVDIRQELIEVQTEKKLIEKQKKIIIEQKMQLEGEKEIISNQNRILQEKKTFLQIQNRQLIEEKKIVEGNLQSQKERIMEIEVECQNLRLLLELQKLQIVALSQIYQRLKVNTIQFHNMTQSTENIVKLSLQTLFNLSLNKLRPEEIIQRLQKIIEIIKVNVKLKFDVTSDLTILQFIKKEQQIAKKDFSAQVTSGLVPYIEGSSSNVKKQIMNQYVNFRSQRDVVDNREEKKVCFVDELRQIQFKIIEKEFDQKPSQNLAEQKSEHSGQQNAAQFIPMANNQNQFSKDMLNSLLLLSLQKIKQTDCQDKKQRVGFDQNFINAMIENLQRMKDNNSGTDQEDFNEMYHKYKQAVDCLQRSQQLNKEYEMKYQIFLNDLKRKGAYQAPQILEQKLFYMQKVIGQQNELIQNQRKEYENTILKQIEKSEQLAQNVLKGIKLSRKKTTHT